MLDVSIKNVTKSYQKGVTVLNGVDFEIKSGELFFLLGPSGCGKSTLLRTIAGFISADSGDIYFGDKRITNVAIEKRKTAMVFQNYALWPHMTVFENVAFGLKVKKVSKSKIKTAVDEMLKIVGMYEYAERKPGSLSGGQQQRVALARALVVDPDVLLLDEPLSNLDAKLRMSMRSEIRTICKKSGVTAIYVTHDRKEALAMADRVAIMNGGVLEQIGTPQELYFNPVSLFVADFIDESNFIEGTVSSIGETLSIDTKLGNFTCVTDATDLTVGASAKILLRPESIKITPGCENSLSAKVIRFVFGGEHSVIDVEVDGVELSLNHTGLIECAEGDTVQIGFSASDAHLLVR